MVESSAEWPTPAEDMRNRKIKHQYRKLPCIYTCSEENWNKSEKYDSDKVDIFYIKNQPAKYCDQHSEYLLTGVWQCCKHSDCNQGVIKHDADSYKAWGTFVETSRRYWCIDHYRQLSVITPYDYCRLDFISLYFNHSNN